ncbi:autotransporter outer membrane beta-barrel domain-containing protein [Telmatospirillum siberiense]|uniref:autotransporter outer membrane beta-barrel domain-containing protein n=1 Tax=Telmatospirillum siberiense TaxID=382514 RepID=UPI0011AF6E91|nr:autotransporter outer membrane beta-barrel domain-containing protein [Telmatospirillum siberiense]
MLFDHAAVMFLRIPGHLHRGNRRRDHAGAIGAIALGVLGILPNAQAWAAACASGGTITSATTICQTLAGGGSLVVGSGGSVALSSGTAVSITAQSSGATITNSGIISDTASGKRAITLAGTIQNTTIINAAGATVSATGDDAIHGGSSSTKILSGSIVIDNSGTIRSLGTTSSTNGQAIDLDNTGGTISIVIDNRAGGLISSADSDAIRPGENATVNNWGTIIGASVNGDTGNDGIDFQSHATGTVNNYAGATISGARHGITGSGDITVYNAGTIIGNLGSGINLDTTSGVASIVNAAGGLITGNASGTSDGDGIDVDYLVNITNAGTIRATGTWSGGLSEAITVGGGTITNSGLITSVQRAITVDDSNGGNAFAATTIINSPTGTIIGNNGQAISITDSFSDTIVNAGLIVGSVSTGGGGDTLTNSGIIRGDITAGDGLFIAGGDNGTVGTLSGLAGGVGTITATGVAFTSGSLFLGDNVVVNGGAGTVTNAASLQIGRAVTISGNYVQGSGGALVVVLSSSSSGALVITGSASLSGSLKVVSDSGVVTAGQTVTIVSAGSLSASNLQTSSNLLFNTVYTITGTSIAMTALPWAAVAATGGGSVGSTLDMLSSNTAYQSLLSQLTQLSSAGQARALKQLGGSPTTVQINTGAAFATPTTAVIEQHQMARAGDAVGLAAGSPADRRALWGQVLGSGASLDGAYSAASWGLLVGGDLELIPDVTGGLAASWLRTNAHGTGDSSGNRTMADSYQLAAYGSWRPEGGQAFLNGLLAFGQDQYDQSRPIDFLGSRASADYDGQHYQAKLGGGYDFALEGIPHPATLSPLFSLQYIRSELSGYAESGAGLADLSVKAKGFDSVESELGGRLATRVPIAWGVLASDIQAGWVHSYTNNPVSVSVAMGGVAFISRSERPAADGARLGLGATLERSDDLSIRLEYDGDYRSDYRSHTGLLQIRQEF